MNIDGITRIAVIGAGLMGHGIGLEFSLAGYDVCLNDVSEENLGESLETIRKSLNLTAGFGLITAEQASAALLRIRSTPILAEAVQDADLVVEAVFEDLDLKRRIFGELDRLCPAHAILASNTSTFLPSSLARATSRPENVLVTHYFNPPFLVPLVEIVPSESTAEETVSTCRDLLAAMGKKPVIVRKEVPGFIANRIQGAVLREALWLVEQGIATAADVDMAIKSSIGRRWAVAGVFEVFEIAGWDLIVTLAEPEPHAYESSPQEAVSLLHEKIAAGELGVKTGKGFYEWTPESVQALRERIAHALVEIDKWA